MANQKPTKPEPDETEKSRDETPAAGPHAKPELTNPDATPGTGSLPDETKEGDADAGAG